MATPFGCDGTGALEVNMPTLLYDSPTFKQFGNSGKNDSDASCLNKASDLRIIEIESNPTETELTPGISGGVK